MAAASGTAFRIAVQEDRVDANTSTPEAHPNLKRIYLSTDDPLSFSRGLGFSSPDSM